MIEVFASLVLDYVPWFLWPNNLESMQLFLLVKNKKYYWERERKRNINFYIL